MHRTVQSASGSYRNLQALLNDDLGGGSDLTGGGPPLDQCWHMAGCRGAPSIALSLRSRGSECSVPPVCLSLKVARTHTGHGISDCNL